MDWGIWRIWRSGRATLHEIETYWSLRDLWQAHQVLDLEEDAEIIAENAIADTHKK